MRTAVRSQVIKTTIELARAGHSVSSVEVKPDGGIVFNLVHDKTKISIQSPETAFEKWDKTRAK